MGLHIAVTGYFGTGSSAVLDLLSEYSCNQTGLKDGRAYEHVAFYMPDGLFDLEDKLLKNNDSYRSDEAVKSFMKAMKRLNDHSFGWFGSYEELFPGAFLPICREFIKKLGLFEIEGRYYGQYKGVRFSPSKFMMQAAAKLLQKRKIYKWGRKYIYTQRENKMLVCFPSAEEFKGAAKEFVRRYLQLFQENNCANVLFDHLLLPQNAYRIPDYFDDDFRLIILERDIRDLFVLNTYIWPEIKAGSLFPRDLEKFILYWKNLRKGERVISDPRILRLSFEDLIYKYKETVKKLEDFCHMDPNMHTKKYQYFKPEVSVKNTQTFRLKKKWAGEGEKLKAFFPDYIYEFPYGIHTEISSMFDDSSDFYG